MLTNEILGQKFGKLTILEIGKNIHYKPKVICKCDCGLNIEVQYKTLVSGHKKSCGCAGRTKIVLHGVYGEFTVKEFLGVINKTRRNFWKCQCSCGNFRNVSTTDLTNGTYNSCGCIRPYNDVAAAYKDICYRYFKTIEYGAKIRNLDFKITIEYIWDLFILQNKKCALSGVDIVLYPKVKDRSKYQTASLDRIDSTKGYVNDNIQWVHKSINFLKSKLKTTEFIDLCTKVANHFKQRTNVGMIQPQISRSELQSLLDELMLRGRIYDFD